MSANVRFPNNPTLHRVLEQAYDLSEQFGQEWRTFSSVGSGGCTANPRLALVFINPTSRNQSTRLEWAGQRAPFIGTTRVWHFLAGCGVIPSAISDDLPTEGSWTPATAEAIYCRLSEQGLYVTNLVKASHADATLPTMSMARAYRESLVRELNVVKPRAVVAMGTMVSSVLGGSPVLLKDEYQLFEDSGSVRPLTVPEIETHVFPCYFPIGRGNPSRAASMLRWIADQQMQAPS